MATIRPARRDDAAAIAGLCVQLGYRATADQIAERLAMMVGLHDVEVVVDDEGAGPIAFMQISIHRTIESGAWAEIDGLVVDERARGRGVGAELVEHARAWARTRRATVLRVRTNEIRERAHVFYEREGFTLNKSQRVYTQGL